METNATFKEIITLKNNQNVFCYIYCIELKLKKKIQHLEQHNSTLGFERQKSCVVSGFSTDGPQLVVTLEVNVRKCNPPAGRTSKHFRIQSLALLPSLSESGLELKVSSVSCLLLLPRKPPASMSPYHNGILSLVSQDTFSLL